VQEGEITWLLAKEANIEVMGLNSRLLFVEGEPYEQGPML
jgi:hypothetical protein